MLKRVIEFFCRNDAPPERVEAVRAFLLGPVRFLWNRERATRAWVAIVIALVIAPTALAFVPLPGQAVAIYEGPVAPFGRLDALRMATNNEGGFAIYEPHSFGAWFPFVQGIVVSLQILTTFVWLPSRTAERIARRRAIGRGLIVLATLLGVVVSGAVRPNHLAAVLWWATRGTRDPPLVTVIASWTCPLVVATLAFGLSSRAPTSGALALFVGERLFQVACIATFHPSWREGLALAAAPLAWIVVSAALLARLELDDERLAWAGLGSCRVPDVALIPWALGALASWLLRMRITINESGADLLPKGATSAIDNVLVLELAPHVVALVALVALVRYLRWAAANAGPPSESEARA